MVDGSGRGWRPRKAVKRRWRAGGFQRPAAVLTLCVSPPHTEGRAMGF